MKNLLTFIIFFIPTCTASAQVKVTASIATGYQSDDFQWSIAGNVNGNSPNILSELIWRHLGGPAIQCESEIKITRSIFVKVSANLKKTLSGTFTDRDYKGDNRSDLLYDDSLKINKGDNTNFSFVAGYWVKVGKFFLAPYLGYLTNHQMFNLNNNFDLNSNYRCSWSGPIVGLAVNKKIVGRLSADADITYGQLVYNAEADWNDIEAFAHPVSFKHTADGYTISGKLRLMLTEKRVSPFFAITYSYGGTGTGVDNLYLKNGSVSTTQLNGVNQIFNGFNVGVSICFDTPLKIRR